MANIKINITDFTIYLPKKTVNNNQLNKLFKLKNDTLFKLTGIKKRRISATNESAESMAIKVALRLAKKYKTKLNISHLITVSNTPSIMFPSMGHYILTNLRKFLKYKPFNIPLNCGCSGYVDALILAHKLISFDKNSKVLIVTSDTYSKYIAPLDKSILPLFGDGASASIVQHDRNGWSVEKEFSESIPNTEETLIFQEINGKKEISMKGPELVNFAIQSVIPTVSDMISNEKQITLFSHQASKIVLTLIKNHVLGINKNAKIPLFYENIGNLVSSSIPILIKQNLSLFKRSKKILIFGFGVGLTHSYIKLKK